jgi:DNA-binding GntR family transcriptional regulator
VRRLDFSRDERIDATYVEHAAILEALRNGQASEAADRLTRHIRASQKAVREITMERIREAAAAHRSEQ